MGAIGLWPLSNRCSRLLKSAQLKESQLIGRTMRSYLDGPARSWYVSRIILRPQLIGSRAIRVLLSQGMGSWLKSPNIEFPCELLALAYSTQGQALLEGSISFVSRTAQRCPIMSLYLAWNWTRKSSSCRCQRAKASTSNKLTACQPVTVIFTCAARATRGAATDKNAAIKQMAAHIRSRALLRDAKLEKRAISFFYFDALSLNSIGLVETTGDQM
jgi:hypothetical protein